MKLHDLGRQHGTDKWDGSHTFQGESYLDIYELYLAPMRNRPINILELGVRGGNSLRMWKSYFPRAHIIGVDFNPDCRIHAQDRIEVVIASQNDASRLEPLAQRVGGFDVVVDDASHISHLTRASFEILFPHLKPGGFYIMEDLGMSWVDYTRHVDDPGFMEGVLKTHLDMGISIENNRADLEEMFRNLLFEMDMNRSVVRFIHFWSKIAIISKALARS